MDAQYVEIEFSQIWTTDWNSQTIQVSVPPSMNIFLLIYIGPDRSQLRFILNAIFFSKILEYCHEIYITIGSLLIIYYYYCRIRKHRFGTFFVEQFLSIWTIKIKLFVVIRSQKSTILWLPHTIEPIVSVSMPTFILRMFNSNITRRFSLNGPPCSNPRAIILQSFRNI